jgi:hypothetical protein
MNQVEWEAQQADRRSALAIGGTAWSNLGPTNVAGRVAMLAVDPNNSAIIYRGTAGGGVWKSTDSGSTWTVLTDSLGDLSIGAVAVAPSNTSIVYVGTGEGALGTDAINGIGFIKSTDGGATWGLPVSVSATKFFDLSVHPTNASELLAATTVGIQKSTDGGATWVTKFSTYSGTALARVPGTPATILATVWDIASASPTWKGWVYRSTDSGETWAKVAGDTAPFSTTDNGRMSIAISASSPTTVFAMSASAAGDSTGCPSDPVDQRGIYRSTDGGTTWALRSNPMSGGCGSHTSILAGQGWYANTITVDRTNASIVYAGGLDIWKSTDGAGTWSKKSSWSAATTASNYQHADVHAMAWQGTTLLIGNDGGMNKTADGATTFSNMNTGVVTRQYYSIALNPTNKPFIIGGAQDNGTNLRTTTTSTFSEVIGGDGFGVAANPTNTTTMFGTVYSSRIFRSTDSGSTWPEITPSYTSSENAPFISPLTMDPNTPTTLYTATNFIWRTTNSGTSWTKLSTTDLGDASSRGYVTKIAVAKSNSSYLLVGTGNGYVRQSTNGGTSWSAALAGLPAKYVAHVEYDPTTTSTFYVSFAGGTTGGRLFKTTNGGSSFTQIDAGLPNFPVHVIKVDPTDSTALYAGSDLGLYKSTDGGTTWARWGTGLPAVSIWDIGILPDGSVVRVATHGRGFWELAVTTSPTYSISGNAGTTGATITAGSKTATSDASSNYTIGGLANGTYTVTPSKSGCTFTPSSSAITVNGANVTSVNFTASCTVATYSISGNVGTSGATVTAGSSSTTSDASSNFTMSGFANGTYTVTPSKSGCTFSPASSSVTVNGANVTGVSFTASCGDTQLTSGVTLTGQSVTLGAWKYYYITVPSGATGLTFATSGATADVDIYTQFNAKPTSSSYVCRPYTSSGNETCSATNPSAGTWWLGVYGYAAGSYSVTATVTTPTVTYSISGSAGTSGATVTAGSKTATSDASNNYSVTGLANGTYTVTPSKSGCTFSPASSSVTVNGANVTGVNFTATCSGPITLFSDGFEAAGWSTAQVAGTAGAWTLSTSGTHPTVTPHAGSYLAKFNSYTSASGNQTRLYKATGFAVGSTYTTVTLKFWMYHDTGYSTYADKVQVQVSTNGGSTWTNVGTAVARYDGTTGWKQHSVDITTYKGTTVNLGFVGQSAYGNDEHLDDVTVTAQ